MDNYVVRLAIPERAEGTRHNLADEEVGLVGVIRELARLSGKFALALQYSRNRLRHGRLPLFRPNSSPDPNGVFIPT